MTPPKEQAKQLVKKLRSFIRDKNFNNMDELKEKSKQCALICVYRTIDLLKNIQDNKHSDHYFNLENEILKQQEVKEEIKKL